MIRYISVYFIFNRASAKESLFKSNYTRSRVRSVRIGLFFHSKGSYMCRRNLRLKTLGMVSVFSLARNICQTQVLIKSY